MEATSVSPARLASLYGRAHVLDRAFYWLRKAYEHRDPHLAYLRIAPMYDNVREHGRYPELISKLRFEKSTEPKAVSMTTAAEAKAE